MAWLPWDESVFVELVCVFELVDEFLVELSFVESAFSEVDVLFFELFFPVSVVVDFVVLSFESLLPELQAAKTNNALNNNKYFFMMEHLHP